MPLHEAGHARKAARFAAPPEVPGHGAREGGGAGPPLDRTDAGHLLTVLGQEEARLALAEDRAGMDLTTRLLGVAGARPAVARFVAEGNFVVAGVPVVETVFRELDPTTNFGDAVDEGTRCEAGET